MSGTVNKMFMFYFILISKSTWPNHTEYGTL